MRRTMLIAVCVALTGLCSACTLTMSDAKWGVQSIPVGAWELAVVKDDADNRSVIAHIDSLETGKAVISIARGLIDEATGLPILSTASNLLSKWIATIDPGKPEGDGT